jgi:hypothetical protein
VYDSRVDLCQQAGERIARLLPKREVLDHRLLEHEIEGRPYLGARLTWINDAKPRAATLTVWLHDADHENARDERSIRVMRTQRAIRFALAKSAWRRPLHRGDAGNRLEVGRSGHPMACLSEGERQ